MIALIQCFCLYSWLSYRALFDWLNPAGYLSSLVVVPVSIGLLFTAVSRAAGSDQVLPVSGATLLAAANAVIYGMTLAIANERRYGTLSLWLGSPQNLFGALLAKILLPALNGLISAGVTAVVLAQELHVPITPHMALQLAWCTLAVICSASGLAILVAALAMPSRDAVAAPNITRSLILLGSGAVISTNLLPLNLHWLHPVLPVGHATAAAVEIIHGYPTPWSLLVTEFAIGALWAGVGYAVLSISLSVAKRRAEWD